MYEHIKNNIDQNTINSVEGDIKGQVVFDYTGPAWPPKGQYSKHNQPPVCV